MKQFLLVISLLLSMPAWAGVEESRDFNFQTLNSWQEMTTFTKEDLYLLQSTSEYSGNVVNISNQTVSVSPVNVTFSTGSSYGGGMVYKIINGNSLHYGLTLYKDASMTVEVSGNCKLKSIQFLDYSTGGDISTIGQPGEYNTVYLQWKAVDSNVSSLTFKNGGSDALIYRMRVVYERPSTPLSFLSSNPAEGKEVPSFSAMQVSYDNAIAKENSSTFAPTIAGPSIEGTKNMSVSYTGSSATLSVSPAITKDGEYTVTIPSGLFENAEGGINEAKTIKFNVYATRTTITGWNANPQEGTYTQVPKDITLTFADDVSIDNTKSGVLTLTRIDNTVAEYPVTFSLDETKRIVTLTNSHGDISEEGTCTIDIPEGAIHNSFFTLNDEKDRWNPAFTLKYQIERQELTEIKNARKLLALSGIGYPTESSTARTALDALVQAFDTSPESWTEEKTAELTAAITAFYNESTVTLPTDGKWYKIIGVNAAPSENCKKTYLFYSDGAVSLSSFDSNSNGVKFKAVASEDKMSFETYDGKKALCVLSDKDYTGANLSNVSAVGYIATKLSLAKLTVEGADKDLQLGKLSITGWLGRDGNDKDCGNSTAAINHDSRTVVTTPTTEIYFGETISSAFIFEETTEPIDEENFVEPEAELENREIDKASDGLTMSIHKVKSAVIKDKTKVKFYKDGEMVSVTGDILTPIENVPTDFKVNTSELTEKGYYDLIMEAGAFTFTPTDNDAAENKQVKDMKLELSFLIKNTSTTPDPTPDPTPDDPTPDPTPDDPTPTPSTNFNVTYEEYSVLQVALRSEQRVTWLFDTDLNDLVIMSASYSDLIPDSKKQVKIVQVYNNSSTTNVVGTGHFEPYPNFAKDYPDFASYKAIRLVMDSPVKSGQLEYSSGTYGYNIPEAAFGDANFGKYLAGDASVQPSACKVNPATNKPMFSVDNEKARESSTASEEKALFANYKSMQSTIADSKLQKDDSKACEKIIADAKSAISALSYDTSKSLDENKALVDAIIAKLETDLATQRAYDASKNALGKSIADATVYYDEIREKHPNIADQLNSAISVAMAIHSNTSSSKDLLDSAKQTLDAALDAAKQAIATGIAEIVSSDAVENATYYSLDGRKLDRKPTKKGVYIVNGRKVVVK